MSRLLKLKGAVRTSQPQYPAPLERSPKAFLSPAYLIAPLTATGTPTIVGTPAGRGFSFGSGNYFGNDTLIQQGSGAGNEPQYNWVMHISFVATSNAATEGIASITAYAAADGNEDTIIQNNAGTARIYEVAVGYTNLGTVVLGKLHTITITYSDLSPYPTKIYFDGVLKKTTNAYRQTTKKCYVGAGYPTAGCANEKIVQFYYEQPGNWTDQQIWDYAQNPNSIFLPLSRNIWVPSAGGTQYNQSAGGTLSFASGAVLNSAGKTLSGVLAFAGAALKSTATNAVGTLSFSGALAGIRTVLVAIGGALSFASGAVVNSTNKVLSGTLSFVGDTTKSVQRALAGTLSFVGDAVGIRTILQAIGGTLSFAGTTAQSIGKQISGTLSFASGAVVRSVGKGIAGTLSFAGGIGKRVAKGVSGVLAFIGALLGTIVGAPAAPNMPPITRRVVISAESRFVVIGVEDRYVEVSA